MDLNRGHWTVLLINYLLNISNTSSLLPVFETSMFLNDDYAELTPSKHTIKAIRKKRIKVIL